MNVLEQALLVSLSPALKALMSPRGTQRQAPRGLALQIVGSHVELDRKGNRITIKHGQIVDTVLKKYTGAARRALEIKRGCGRPIAAAS